MFSPPRGRKVAHHERNKLSTRHLGGRSASLSPSQGAVHHAGHASQRASVMTVAVVVTVPLTCLAGAASLCATVPSKAALPGGF